MTSAPQPGLHRKPLVHFRAIRFVAKDDDSSWMGTPEAATYIGITQRTFYRLIDAGSVPAYKMGRVIRIKRSDLDAFLEASRVQPGELRHLNPPRRPQHSADKLASADSDALRVARARSFARPAPDDLCPCGQGVAFGECHGG